MNVLKSKPFIFGSSILLIATLYFLGGRTSGPATENKSISTDIALKRSFDVEVRSVGELEASRSNMISSSLRGDQGKIIQLIADGTYVKPGELLIKLDPTPFEEAIEEQRIAIREQECKEKALEQSLECEICQTEHERQTAEFEVRTAKLELDKIVKGDGPQELARLQSVMQKAFIRYEEFNSYSADLIELENQGFLNSSELIQAKKKLSEEKESYEIAKLEHDTVVNYVLPMRIEKATTSLLRADSKLEEAIHLGSLKVAKAKAVLEHAQQELIERKALLQNSYAILAQTEIKAPAPGIVVHREEFRSGQRRKPRIGDVVMRNQPLLDLPDLDSMVVKTKVREVDLFKISIGKPALISVDAYPNLLLKGKVLSIGVLAITDPTKMGEEKFFDVVVELEQGDPRLRPGMTSRVVIQADKIRDQLTIPVYAVFEKNNQPFCYVVKKDKFALCPVILGASNEHYVEIKSGVLEFEKVSLQLPPKHTILPEL